MMLSFESPLRPPFADRTASAERRTSPDHDAGARAGLAWDRGADAQAADASRGPRVLVVDDEQAVGRAIALNLRAEGYVVEMATSGGEAIARLREETFALLLCDVRMPGVSGLDVLREALAIDPDLAVIMLTGVLDARTATTALRAGALDYITKPFETGVLFRSVAAALHESRQRAEQRRLEALVRDEVLVRTAELEQRTTELDLERLTLRDMTVNVAEALITAMEAKDVYLRGHSQRVAELAAAIAEELGCGSEMVERVRLAGRLHDVGKIGISEVVLNKPATLTPKEYAHVQQHVAIGVAILRPLTHLGEVVTFVHHHHERWDGTGYPQELAGDAISLGGQILAAADMFDALTSARAYRAPMSREMALGIIGRQRGEALSPDVHDALVAVVARRRTLDDLETS